MGVRERYNNTKNNTLSEVKDTKKTSVKDRYEKSQRKLELERLIGFDTFESDLKSLGTTIEGIYGGWQNSNTMSQTKTSVEAMQKRINAYQEYRGLVGSGSDLTELANGYKSVLSGWDDLASLYGQYKNADSYNNEQTRLKELDAMTMADIEPYLKDKNNSIAYTTVGGQDISWQSLYDSKKHKEMASSEEGIKGLDKYNSDKKASQKKPSKQESWAEMIIRGFVTSSDTPVGTALNNVVYDKRKDTSYREPGADWTEEEKRIFGAYYLKDKQSAYDYATKLNNAKAMAKKNETKSKVEGSATSDFWAGAGHTLGAIVTAPFAMADYLDDLTDIAAGRGTIVEEGVMTPFEYSQAVTGGISSKLNDMSGTLNKDIPIIGGKGLGDVYGLGTSIAQSAVSAHTLGSAGTLISYFGQGAASGVDDALSRGATSDQALLYGTFLGTAEGLSEMIGADNLLKIGSSRTLKEYLVNVFKQAGAESLEEAFSSFAGNVADNFIMQDKSQFNASVREYIAQGMSEEEAKKKAWMDAIEGVAYDTLSGFISGGVHAGPGTAIATHKQNVQDKKIGQQIRDNGRVSDMWELSAKTPEMSEAYKTYTEYFNTGVNEENITNAQLGRLYNTAYSDADSTLKSRKASVGVKGAAYEDMRKLNTISTEKVTKTKSGEEVKIEGIKTDGTKEILITDKGEFSTSELSLSGEVSDAITYAKTFKDEAKANAFLSQYDGSTNVDSYAQSFQLAYAYGESMIDSSVVLEHKGVLTERQASEIWKAGMQNRNAQEAIDLQKKLDEINQRYTEHKFSNGIVDDSIIDYKSKDSTKVKWNSLTRKQRNAITFVKAFAEGTGVNLKFIQSKVVNGERKGKNGSYDPETNTIEIDVYAGIIDAKALNDSIISTVSHEVTHWMKNKSPAMYKNMQNLILDTVSQGRNLSVNDLIAESRDKLDKNHTERKHSDEEAIDEIVARGCEDMLSNSRLARQILGGMSISEQKTFVGRLKATIENLTEWVDELLSAYKSNSVEARTLREYKEQLNELSKMWDKALAEAIQTNQSLQKESTTDKELKKDTGIQLSDREFASAIEEWAREGRPDGETFILGSTGDVLQGLGAIESDIYMNGDKIKIILNDHEEITLDEIKKIPRILQNPILVLASKNTGRGKKSNSRVVMFGSVKAKDGRPVLSVLDLRPVENHLVIDDMQKVTSVYTKDNNPVEFVSQSDVLYVDKKRTTSLLRTIGFQMPIELNESGYIGSISYVDQNVKLQGKNFNDIVQYSNRDSDGNQLTKEQVEFFKDSKVRDEEGNLIVAYHGTDADFNTFDADYISSDNKLGVGFYFLIGKKLQFSYKHPKQVYLNITNPITDNSKKISKESLTRFCKKTGIQLDYDSDNYDLDIYERLSYEYTGRAKDFLNNVINILGVDGVISKDRTTAVAFSPNQIKNTTNKQPTKNADIRYSDREASYKTDEYYSQIIPASREDASRLNMLDERNIARYRKEIDGVFDGSLPTGRDIIIGMPSNVLKEYGVSDRVIHMSQRIVRKIAYPLGYKIGNTIINKPTEQKIQGDMEGKHNLGISAVKNLPLQIADPIAITKNNEQNSNKNSIVIWTNWITEDGKGVILGLVIDSKGATGLQNNVSTVFQADEEYAKRFFENKENILYTKNKKDIDQLLSVRRYVPKARVDDILVKRLAEKYPDVKHYSDREAESTYDILGERDRVIEENRRLDEDFARLKGVIGADEVPIRRFRSLADYLNKLSGSNVNRETLGDLLQEVYTYIQNEEDSQWSDVMTKTYEIASKMMNRGMGVPINYFQEVMAQVRKDKVSLSEEQRAEAETLFGGYSNFHKAMFGRVNIVNDGKPLTEMWKMWSKLYPSVFKSDISEVDQVKALVDTVEALKSTSTLMGEYEREEAIRHLSTEIYNQFWNIASDSSEDVKKAKAEHRKMMEVLRKDYEQRQKEKTLHPVGETALKYEKLLKKVSERDKAELRKAKELGRQRVSEVRERAERNAKIQKITKNAKLLNEWLTKNTKDKHISEELKGPVRDLLVTIDFASRGSGIDTSNYSQALAQISKSVSEAKQNVDLRENLIALQDAAGEDEALKRAGLDFTADIKKLTENLSKMSTKTDALFVLRDMSYEDLAMLDKIVTSLKTVVTRANQYYTLRRKQSITSSAHELFDLFDSLGDVKEGKLDGVQNFFNYENITPIHFFDRLGDVGQDLFKSFIDAQSKLAFHTKLVKEFSDKTWDAKDVKKWDKDLIEFEVIDAKKTRDITNPVTKKVYTTTSRLMTLYLHDKREQSQGHLYKGGGGRFTTFEHKGKKIGEDVNGVVLTPNLVQEMLTKLDPKAKKVADAISGFLNTTCKDWGNEITTDLYGVELFLEPKYVPIEVIAESVSREMEKPQRSITALLNKGFTKETKPNAKNQIVLDSIFNVFAKHTSEMMTYNAFAREVYDAVRLFEYNENRKTYVYDSEDGQTVSDNIQIAMKGALGDGAVKYFRNFLEDVNGTQQAGRGDNMLGKWFSNFKLASVAWNMNVALLQPLSLTRAMMVVKPKYLSLGVFGIKKGIQNAMEHSGTALWKSYGYRDTDIAPGLTEQIANNKRFSDKLKEASMKAPEVMDRITWGALWSACERQIEAENKALQKGSKEFIEKVVELFDEAVYRTQVMDSVLTRSQAMRSKNGLWKGLTSFMAEPTVTYNMVYGVFAQWNQYSRSGHTHAQCSKKYGKKLAGAIGTYCIASVAEASLRTMTTAMRNAGGDDDEDENVFIEQLFENLNPLSKIPIGREILSVLQGYGVSTIPGLNAIESFADAYKAMYKMIVEGDEISYKKVYKLLKAVSYGTGQGVSNAYRDVIAIWNSTIGQMYPSLIIDTDE